MIIINILLAIDLTLARIQVCTPNNKHVTKSNVITMS